MNFALDITIYGTVEFEAENEEEAETKAQELMDKLSVFSMNETKRIDMDGIKVFVEDITDENDFYTMDADEENLFGED